MGQKKLIRFAEILEFRNVLQYPRAIKGKWNDHFSNHSPITLELACGKGEYTVGLARMHQDRNFIGVDLKGNRIWVGAKKALAENLENAAFLRTHIDKITDYFEPGEVKEIWITFPDPQLRVSHAKKRLTHPKYLRLYQQILEPGGLIHLKTDSPDLYAFTLLVIDMYGLPLHKAWDNVYAEDSRMPELNIKTHYESLDIAGSSRIHYICFSLPTEPLHDLDVQLKEALRIENVKQSNELNGI
jgi:tRNA (guanine-N7-)-methyltransferase